MSSILSEIEHAISKHFGLFEKQIYGKRPIKSKKLSIDVSSGYLKIDPNSILWSLTLIYMTIKNKRNKNRKPSENNWIFRKKTETNHKDGEDHLERIIAKNVNFAYNQMSTLSGLFDQDQLKRCAIDLVYANKNENNNYELIELKIDSDTPVYATYEIIFRFIAYSYYKINFMCGQISHSKNNSDYDLFSAKKIFLTVLAPKEYYDEYNLIVFEKSINEALKKWIEHKNKHIACLPQAEFLFKKFDLENKKNFNNFSQNYIESIAKGQNLFKN